MPIVVSVETHVPPDAAWAWWTDYGPVGSETLVDHGIAKTWRTIREREGDRIVMVERLAIPGRPKALRRTVEVDDAHRRLVETSPSFRATWTFEPTVDGGTRITRSLELTGVGRFSPPPLSRWAMARDLRTHVQAMEEEIGG